MPGMTSGLSKCQKRCHSAYLYPLWRFLREDRMGIFVLNRLSHVSHLSDVGLIDFDIPFLGLR